MIALGVLAKDDISGFEGVITGRSEYLYGCVQVHLTPRGCNNNGQPIDAKWFDEPQVTMIDVDPFRAEETGEPTGGPERSHSQPNTPPR